MSFARTGALGFQLGEASPGGITGSWAIDSIRIFGCSVGRSIRGH